MCKVKENPFQSRWKLDDKQWMKQRRQQWKYVKQNLDLTFIKSKDMKHFKAFFIEGTEPPEPVVNENAREGFSSIHRLAFTPCDTTQEVKEVFSFCHPLTYRCLLDFAAFGELTETNNPFGYAGPQQKIIAEALLAKQYSEEIIELDNQTFEAYLPASELVTQYEQAVYQRITAVDRRPFAAIMYWPEHYISCVKFLEDRGDVEIHHAWFPHLLSCVFNFVDPVVTGNEPSEIREFVEKLSKLFQASDAPDSIKKAIAELGPNRLIECPVDTENEDSPLTGIGRIASTSAAPSPKVLHGMSIFDASVLFFKSILKTKLLGKNDLRPNIESVNLAPMLSDEFIQLLGYSAEKEVPAYQMSFWFKPSVRFSNHVDAKFGVDLFFIYYDAQKNIDEQTPTLIYYPRINHHYHDYYPSEPLRLMELQLRRCMYNLSGIHMLVYTDRVFEDKPPNYFVRLPTFLSDFRFLKSNKSGSMELAIDGPDAVPWEGEPLPVLDLDAIKSEVEK